MAGEKWLLCFRIWWLLLVLLKLHHIECLCSAKESQALLDLKGEDQSHALSSWRQDSDCCRGWAGVFCEASGTHVIALNLTENLQLPSGYIPGSFCNLCELQFANISFVSPIDSNNAESRQRLSPDLHNCIWNMTRDKSMAIAMMEMFNPEINPELNPWSTDHQQRSSSPPSICDVINSGNLPGNLTQRLDEIGGGDEEGLFPDCILGMNKLHHLEQNPCKSSFTMQFKSSMGHARLRGTHSYARSHGQQYGWEDGLAGETRRKERSQRYKEIERPGDEGTWDEAQPIIDIE